MMSVELPTVVQLERICGTAPNARETSRWPAALNPKVCARNGNQSRGFIIP
jgi:hypothetical protein